MPPITSAPQNTRATLITWLVVFVILFVVAAVFAIYYDVQWNKADQMVTNLNSKYKSVISDNDLAGPEFTVLTTPPKTGGPVLPAFTTLLNQRNAMERLLAGSDKASFDDVANNTKNTLVAVGDQLKKKGVSVTLPNNMLAAIRAMGDQVAASADAAAKAQADAKAAHDDAMKVTAERDRLLADKDKQIAAVNDQLKTVQEQLAEYQKTKNASVDEMLANAKLSNETANKRAEVLQTSLSQYQQQVASMQKTLEDFQRKIDHYRLNPNDSMQQPDGRITKVPGNGTVYINIGQLDSVTPGLTFEVYDKSRGLPKLQNPNNQPEDNGDLPQGKASIEVIRVLPGASECRIVRTAPGQIITEGDLIENLVYDPRTKYNFYVFGNFDVSQSGTANPADADLIRRLVTQWGGKLQNGINVDTDFVVMGKEPTVPNLSDEEKTNPLAMQRYEEAVRNHDMYQTTLNKAMELRIPILNQNRFLYFTGYYDQASR